MATVLFACVHNAGRSQMAAAFFNTMADPTKARAASAGTEPAAFVQGGVTPRLLTLELVAQAALLITMGCGEACPVVPGVEWEDWNLPDPKGLPPERVLAIRDEIRGRVKRLVAARGWHAAAPRPQHGRP
jgi:arsenate reductase